MRILGTEFRFRGDVSSEWAYKNPVLAKNEIGVEEDNSRFKIGDGETEWAYLPYYVNQDEISEMIYAAMASAGGSSNLIAHINDPEPHPAYDDGPSLLLLYQNAKV
jgi:hypothetical protein